MDLGKQGPGFIYKTSTVVFADRQGDQYGRENHAGGLYPVTNMGKPCRWFISSYQYGRTMQVVYIYYYFDLITAIMRPRIFYNCTIL